MWNLGKSKLMSTQDQCGPFHDVLEELNLPPDAVIDRSRVLAAMTATQRQHALACSDCLEAVDEFAGVHNLLLPVTRDFSAPKPGPWFSAKVMNAVAAQEVESDTVWAGVRRLAPRLAGFCALLLVLAGTWAFQVKQDLQARQLSRPAESLFEPFPSAPLNDDVMASVGGVR